MKIEYFDLHLKYSTIVPFKNETCRNLQRSSEAGFIQKNLFKLSRSEILDFIPAISKSQKTLRSLTLKFNSQEGFVID